VDLAALPSGELLGDASDLNHVCSLRKS
jgi:hypothetical protein